MMSSGESMRASLNNRLCKGAQDLACAGALECQSFGGRDSFCLSRERPLKLRNVIQWVVALNNACCCTTKSVGFNDNHIG